MNALTKDDIIAERNWARELSGELDNKRKEIEIGDFEKIISKLSVLTFCVETPQHLKKTLSTFQIKIIGEKINKQIYKLYRELILLMREDLHKDTEFRKYISQKLKDKNMLERDKNKILPKLMKVANDLKTKEEIISQEFLDVIKYWEYVSTHGKLPGYFNKLKIYNNKKITWPFKHLIEEEKKMLKEMSSFIKS